MTPLPDLPTIEETLPGYEAVLWYGMWGPRGLPRPIVALWNAEVGKSLDTEEMKKRLAADATENGGGTPERFVDVIRRDVEKWTRVVKTAKVQAER